MRQSKFVVVSIGILYGVLVFWNFIRPVKEYSVSERRRLAQRPELSVEQIFGGNYEKEVKNYIEKWENYIADQFPGREWLRFWKNAFSVEVMQKLDVNGIYEKNGFLCAMEYPVDERSLSRAAGIFRRIYEKNLKGTEAKGYLVIVPDKNYFLAGDTHLSMEYESFFETMYGKTEFLTAISIADQLQITDYYKTDSHWRQEKLLDVAEAIQAELGSGDVAEKGTEKYTIRRIEKPFYGVYYGQAALPVRPDTLCYCTGEALEQYMVYDHENKKEIPLYDMEKAEGRDGYEMFLGGNASFVTITNPLAVSEKELVVFGDSFSRSLVPLLAEGYRKTTLYDIRYLPSASIGNYITFTDQDVLFLYSTSVLNNSITLK